MNFFNLFGNKKKEPTISTNNAITTMKEILTTLEKREKFLEHRILEYKTEAQKLVKKNKTRAIILLKKVKLTENQLNSVYNQKNNLETQILVIEQTITNKNIISVMKHGKTVLENMNKTMDPDDIGEFIDDVNTNINMVEEVSNVLAEPIGPIYDENELLEELDNLEKAEKAENKEYEEELVLPNVPLSTTIKKKTENTEEEENEELLELKKLMTI